MKKPMDEVTNANAARRETRPGMSRRQMMGCVLASMAMAAAGPISAAPGGERKRMGIGMHSYGAHWKAGKEKHPQARFSDALEFLRYAREIGAGGVQVAIGQRDSAYAATLRRTAESSGLYFEAQTSLPKDAAALPQFEAEVRLAREAGADVMRTALLNGRRYETFASAGAFQQFKEQASRSLTLAEPVVRRHKLRLAVENHKDWLSAEFVELLRRLASEYVGACVDTGNNLALLEEPAAVVEALAPYAFATHIKDMAVQEYAEGFLLSEVPMGSGFLDLPRMVEVLQKANPKIQFSVEMITRDPLKIPCLTPGYWATMADVPASRLAATLALVRTHQSATPLLKTTGLTTERQLELEDNNVRACLAYAREKLGL